MDFFFSVQELLDIEGVLGVIIGGVLVVRVLGQVVLVAQKWAHAPQLQDALTAVQHRKLVPAQQFMPHLLERGAIAGAVTTGVRGVECVNGLFSQHFRQVFQGGGFGAAEENLAVHVAHDSVRIVLVDGFQLATGLQYQTGGNLTAADGRHQLFQIGNLPDVGALVDQTAYMDGQLAAVHIICFIAKQIEKLRVDHADEKIKGGIRVRHNEEKRRFLITQRVQLQFIVHGEVPQFLDVEGGEPSTAGNEDGFCGLARDKLSRTF